MLEIEREKGKSKHNELLIEKEKTKHAQLKIYQTNSTQTAARDINNISFNINIANIESLNQHNMTIEEARENFSPDMISLVTNVLKHQYNSRDDELKNNKCIKPINNSKYVVKTDNHHKEVKFSDIREIVLKNFKKIIENTEDRFYPTETRIEQKVACLTEEIIDIYKNSIHFTHNIRNNGLVNKALTKAVV